MTTKEKVISSINKLPENVSIDEYFRPNNLSGKDQNLINGLGNG